MKRLLAVIVLAIIILITFTFTALKLGALGSQNNYFNSRLRASLAQYLIMRELLGLHYDGDGKSDYLGPKYSKIKIEVASMEGLTPKKEVLDQVVSSIEATTGKPTEIANINSSIPYYQFVNHKDLDNLVNHFKTEHTSQDTAWIFLLVASTSSDQENLIGTTYNEDGIIVLNDALDLFTKDEPQTKNSYLISTILHEFGHQIGLQHNELKDCLMQSVAETSRVPRKFRQEVITNFCEQEKNQINTIRRHL